MKKIGIIGGMGPEATVDYYNEIINTFKSRKADLHYPEMIIYSVNLGQFISLMKENRYDDAARLLAEKIESLRRAGAEFAAISANTPHILFDRIVEKSKIPLILTEEEYAGIPMLNTTRIHVRAILDYALE